jgi:F-type H+-transporting ATPase subunit b
MRAPRAAVAAASMLAAATWGMAAEESAGGSALIEPHFGTAFWTLVTFLVMAFLLGRYAWKPLLGALEAREKTIRDSIEQAARDRDEARAMLDEHRKLVDQARRERAEAMGVGQRDAEKLKADILDEARRQREHLLEQAESRIRSELRAARAELRTVAADLAIRAAEKLLTRNLDDATQRRLVETYLEDLEQGEGAPSPPS